MQSNSSIHVYSLAQSLLHDTESHHTWSEEDKGHVLWAEVET